MSGSRLEGLGRDANAGSELPAHYARATRARDTDHRREPRIYRTLYARARKFSFRTTMRTRRAHATKTIVEELPAAKATIKQQADTCYRPRGLAGLAAVVAVRLMSALG